MHRLKAMCRSRGGATRRGTLTILFILAVALSFVLANAAYQWRRSSRPVAFWGADAARRILRSNKIEAARLEPLASTAEGEATDAEDDLLLDGKRWHLADRREVGRVAGFSHIARVLLQSSAFAWEERVAPPLGLDDDAPRAGDAYALGFHGAATNGADRAVVWLVFFEGGLRVSRAGTGRWASMRPAALGLRSFFEAQFAPPQGTTGQRSAATNAHAASDKTAR